MGVYIAFFMRGIPDRKYPEVDRSIIKAFERKEDALRWLFEAYLFTFQTYYRRPSQFRSDNEFYEYIFEGNILRGCSNFDPVMISPEGKEIEIDVESFHSVFRNIYIQKNKKEKIQARRSEDDSKNENAESDEDDVEDDEEEVDTDKKYIYPDYHLDRLQFFRDDDKWEKTEATFEEKLTDYPLDLFSENRVMKSWLVLNTRQLFHASLPEACRRIVDELLLETGPHTAFVKK